MTIELGTVYQKQVFEAKPDGTPWRADDLIPAVLKKLSKATPDRETVETDKFVLDTRREGDEWVVTYRSKDGIFLEVRCGSRPRVLLR